MMLTSRLLSRELVRPRGVRRCSDLGGRDRECRFELLDGKHSGIAVISLNRPQARNALGNQLVAQFREAVHQLNRERSVRVAVLRSEVPGVFCAGADLKERLKMSQSEVGAWFQVQRQFAQDIGDIPVPTIAALDGAALGGGLEISLWCDLRTAADSAKIGLVETKLAVIPGAGGTQNLPRLIGMAKAKELIYTAKIMNGNEALEVGLVNKCAPQNENHDAAYLLALGIAEEIAGNGPVALRMAKMAINKGMQVDLVSGFQIEGLCYNGVIPTKDRTEGLMAFREKRKPNYTGE